MERLRVLREEMLFQSADAKRVRNPVNEMWAGSIARKVVSAAVDDGSVDGREAAWFRRALVVVFFVEDEDDRLFAAMEGPAVCWRD